MQPEKNSINLRRDFLLQALSSGALIGGLGWQSQVLAGWFGSRPRKMPQGRSIFELEGRVLVNGKNARKDTLIRSSDTVETAPGGKIIFAVGQNAYVLRERSVLEMEGKDLLVRGLQLISGAMLGVFGKRRDPLTMRARNATIGIRGTALYSEIFPERSYVCTCYGEVELQAGNQPEQRERVRSRHHDAPRWVSQTAKAGIPLITPAPMMNHSDLELMLLEALCGREVPFATPLEPVDGTSSGY